MGIFVRRTRESRCFALTSPEGGGERARFGVFGCVECSGWFEKVVPCDADCEKHDDFGDFCWTPKGMGKLTFLTPFLKVFLRFPGPHRGTEFCTAKRGSRVGTGESKKTLKKGVENVSFPIPLGVRQKTPESTIFRHPSVTDTPSERQSRTPSEASCE